MPTTRKRTSAEAPRKAPRSSQPASRTQVLADALQDLPAGEELLPQPHGHRGGELPQPAGRHAEILLEQPLELEERLVVEADVVDGVERPPVVRDDVVVAEHEDHARELLGDLFAREVPAEHGVRAGSDQRGISLRDHQPRPSLKGQGR